MSKNAENSNLRKITVEISNECWKELKVISIRKEISLGSYVAEVLEKHVGKVKESK